MKNIDNEFGQSVGFDVNDWQPPPAVQSANQTQILKGRYCQLVKLNTKHASLLSNCFEPAENSLWTYMPYGPFQTHVDYVNWIQTLNKNDRQDTFAYCIQSTDSTLPNPVLGVCAYLRIMPAAGSIEIGHLSFSPALQKTRAASEVLFLMIDAVFKLGYRRCEWKCNDLNLPSISAAKRFGFSYEGTFRHAQVVKGHNRNTAWFSILDHEWKKLRPGFIEWLAPNNFDETGKQKKRLSDITSGISKVFK